MRSPVRDKVREIIENKHEFCSRSVAEDLNLDSSEINGIGKILSYMHRNGDIALKDRVRRGNIRVKVYRHYEAGEEIQQPKTQTLTPQEERGPWDTKLSNHYLRARL